MPTAAAGDLLPRMRANGRAAAAAAEAPSATPSPSSAQTSPVLFLDVDGVLNVRVTTTSSGASSSLGGDRGPSAADGFSVLHGSLLQRLAGVIRATNARVVLSSTWRLNAASRERVRRRLCVELFLGGSTATVPPPLQMGATPCVSTAELLVSRRDPLVAACDTLATQRVMEICKWIQQWIQQWNQVQTPHAVTNGDISPSGSNSSNPVGASDSVLAVEWVALDDLDLLGAATKLSTFVLLAPDDLSRHFVRTNPAKGLSVKGCERLVELLGPSAAAGTGTTQPWRSSAARALQQRVDLLFVVDARAPVALSDGPVVVAIDTSTFQVVAELQSLEEARAWVVANDEVVLFDDTLVTILEIVEEEAPSQEAPLESQVDDDEPDPLVWLRRRHYSFVKWTQDVPQGQDETSLASLVKVVVEQLCQVATATRASDRSGPAALESVPAPSPLFLHLLECLDELEAQEFDAEVAQTRFSRCGFSQQQRALLAANPVVARHLLHLIPLVSSTSNVQHSSFFTSNIKHSRYCELLLGICQCFPDVAQSALRQHLGEYVVRDELTSLAALEAVAFAVDHDSDGAILSGELDELICCCC